MKVCVTNPTSGFPTVTFSGDIVTGNNTCTSAKSTFSESRTFTMNNGATECFNPAVPTDTSNPNDLLDTGMWVMKFTYTTTVNGVANTSVTQYQKVPIVFNNDSPTPNRTVVNWTYFPNVFSVNTAGDGAITSCTSNCASNCTLRHALKCANDKSSSSSMPVLVSFGIAAQTITMTDSAALTLGANGKITLDGINSSGKPWIVGDFKPTQDAFSWVVDLNNTANFVVTSSKNVIQGLWIKNAHTAGTAQAKHLIDVQSGQENIILASKLDGGNNCTTQAQCACPGTGNCPDLIHGASGLSFSTPAVTVRNAEGLSALDQGVGSSDLGYVTVKDGWFHNNLRGDMQAEIKGKLKAERNMVELAGRVSGASGAPLFNADGFSVLGDVGGTSELNTDANIVRLNSNNGIGIKNQINPKANAFNDYLCGGTAQGYGISTPVIATGQGLAAVYNQNRGVNVIPVSTGGTVDFGGGGTSSGNNAFARNILTCDVRNDASISVKAQNNQWGPDGNPLVCGSNSALIDTTSPQDHATVAIALDTTNPTVPSNVFLKDQSVRVRGSGFNAINGNPAPTSGPDCVRGNPDPPYTGGSNTPCCLVKPQGANVCDTGTHNPFHDGSQCVEFLDGQAAWRQATAVSSVTPTTIVVGVPQGNGGGIPCMGGMGEKIWLSKWDYKNSIKKEDSKPWCTNAAQKDIF